MGMYGAIIGGVAGAAMGAGQKGQDLDHTGVLGIGANRTHAALSAYQNLVNAGPGASDVGNSLTASRNYGSALLNASQTGGFNMQQGNQLAAQQYAGQRTSMEQSFQDQLAQANRAASLSGRSSNDPILRARLAQDQTRQQAQLMSNQSSAAIGLGLQYTQNSLGLQGQQVGVLQGLSNQAFTNGSNMYQMASAGYQQDFNNALTATGYENSRGGGAQGMMSGAMSGAAAGSGMGMGSGMSSMGSSMGGGSGMDRAGGTTSMSSDYLSGGAGYGGGGSSMSLGASSMGGNRSSAQTFAPQSAPSYMASSPPQMGVSSPSALGGAYSPYSGNYGPNPYSMMGGGNAFSYK
jgi:hypothetical protein